MQKPCIVSIGRYHITGILIAQDDGLSTVRFLRDELTESQRAVLGWKSHGRERIKVFNDHQVKVTG